MRTWISLLLLAAVSAFAAPPTLEDVKWQFISPNASDRGPFLQLDSKTKRVSGSGGCNRIMGSYDLNGEKLTFGQIASTMMACPGIDIEQKFLKTLALVKGWKLKGNHLELLDAQDGAVATFEVK